MAQNIYDRPDFFAGYSQLERSVRGLDGAAEWPLIRSLLPDMAGLHVVDLGCGFGWFCRWAQARGAASVLGLDLSENMLARARADTANPSIHYDRMDLEHLALPDAAFEFAYSSLVFHYIQDLSRLFAAIHRGLKPGGGLVFSMEHPLLTAPTYPAWTQDAEGRRIWPLDGYGREGQRSVDWLAPGVVKFHRTLGNICNSLLRSGFVLTGLHEFSPDDSQIAERPEWDRERDRPPFLIIAACRPGPDQLDGMSSTIPS